METLTTPRLVLRPFTMRDLDDFFEYAQNPNVGPNAGWQEHKTRKESSKMLRSIISQKQSRAIVQQDCGKVIGSIGLHPDPKRINSHALMIGYALGEPYWGKGYATEAALRLLRYAFEVKSAGLVSISHYTFNHRSKRVIEKCGFLYEGTMRQSYTMHNGQVYDEMIYSMTRAEYHEKYPRVGNS